MISTSLSLTTHGHNGYNSHEGHEGHKGHESHDAIIINALTNPVRTLITIALNDAT